MARVSSAIPVRKRSTLSAPVNRYPRRPASTTGFISIFPTSTLRSICRACWMCRPSKARISRARAITSTFTLALSSVAICSILASRSSSTSRTFLRSSSDRIATSRGSTASPRPMASTNRVTRDFRIDRSRSICIRRSRCRSPPTRRRARARSTAASRTRSSKNQGRAGWQHKHVRQLIDLGVRPAVAPSPTPARGAILPLPTSVSATR